MTIHFTPNDRPTVGVEMELNVVDATSGALVSAAPELLDELGAGHAGGEHPKAKHELFQSTVEIITGVCETPDEAGNDLRTSIAELRAVCDQRDLTLISAGTHPFAMAREQDVSPDQRYHDLIESMQWPARRLLICGLHVHVGVSSGPRAIAIINELRRHLPLFLALSASSPYFEGEDSGLASARSKVFESLPTAGLPPDLADWGDFEMFMSTLLESNCISSIREVWWDIRPHPDFGTIEFRMCDATPTVRESVALAGLAQTLVSWCDQRIDDGTLPIAPREWTVRENRWLAARFGVDAHLIVEHPESGHPERCSVHDLLIALVDELWPTAEQLGTTAQLQDLVMLLEVGSGAVRQRRVVEGGGTLVDVVHHLVDSLATDTYT